MPTRTTIETTEDQFDATDASHTRALVDNSDLAASDPVVKALVVLKDNVDALINNDLAQEDTVTSIIQDKNYIHTQSSSATTWVVTHSLAKYPSVEVVDSAGTVVVGQVDYDSLNQVTLTFNSTFSGKAYFN